MPFMARLPVTEPVPLDKPSHSLDLDLGLDLDLDQGTGWPGLALAFVRRVVIALPEHLTGQAR
jgi:hypothetical protein